MDYTQASSALSANYQGAMPMDIGAISKGKGKSKGNGKSKGRAKARGIKAKDQFKTSVALCQCQDNPMRHASIVAKQVAQARIARRRLQRAKERVKGSQKEKEFTRSAMMMMHHGQKAHGTMFGMTRSTGQP